MIGIEGEKSWRKKKKQEKMNERRKKKRRKEEEQVVGRWPGLCQLANLVPTEVYARSDQATEKS